MPKYYFIPSGKISPVVEEPTLQLSAGKFIRGIEGQLRASGATAKNTIVFNAPTEKNKPESVGARLTAIMLVTELECRHGEEQKWLNGDKITFPALRGENPNNQTIPKVIEHVVFVASMKLMEAIAEDCELEYSRIPGGRTILVLDTATDTCIPVEIGNG